MSMLEPSPAVPVDDPDARLGGHDDPVPETMLEAIHEEAEKVKPRLTRYEVQLQIASELDNDHPRMAWMPVGVAEASSARDAIRVVAQDDEMEIEAGDLLRAIPIRNITQVRLDVETTTKLRLS